MRRLVTILIALQLVQSLDAQDLQKGLVGCYSFTGNANDGSGHNRNGIVRGATLTTDRFGNANSAYQFGLNKYIQVPQDSLSSTYWTYSAWVKFISFPVVPKRVMVESNIVSSLWFNGILVDISDSQQSSLTTAFTFEQIDFGFGVSTPLTSGVSDSWIHVASIAEGGGRLKMFINGISVIDTTTNSYIPGVPKTQIYNQRQVIIGESSTAVSEVTVIIDDVAIYNRAISDAEVQLLYEGILPCSPASMPYVRSSYVCRSDTTILTAAGGINFRWYDAPTGGNLLLSGNPYHAVVPSGTVDYYVAEIVNGTEGSRAKITVTAVSSPQITCSIPAGTLTNVQLSVSSSSSGGVLPLTNTFDFGDQTQVSTISTSVNHSYSTPGNYFVTVTTTDARHCATTCSDSIQVVSLPTVMNTSICPGNPATLTAAGARQYRWYDSEFGGTLLSEKNPFVTPPLAGVTTYYVAALLNNSETIRTKVVVNLFLPPMANCLGPGDVLPGGLIKISATTTSGTKPFTFLYKINGEPQPPSTSPELSFQKSQADLYTVELRVIDFNQCESTCAQTVEVVNAFIPNVITANGDNLNNHLSVFKKIGDDYEPYTGSLQFYMTIVNRYGKTIYTTTDNAKGWNGQGADAGVYFYEITFGEKQFKGWVSVIK